MYKTKNGYMEVVLKNRQKKYVHRMVIEEHLGRPLTRQESVHHINGDNCDNRIENLQVLINGDHVKLHNALTPHPVCSVEGCSRLTKALGLCTLHYQRKKHNVKISSSQSTRGIHVGCFMPDCDRPHKAHGFCIKHYQYFKKHGVFT